MALLLVLVFCFYYYSNAQTQTTDNLVYTSVSPAPAGATYNWTGFVVTNSNGGGLVGGNVPGYNPLTGVFLFGYTQSTIAYSMAVNTALSGTGIQVKGINYGLEYYNQDIARGNLSTTVSLTSNTGSVLQSYTHVLDKTTGGWTNFDRTQTFTNQYSLANIGNVSMSFSGKDDRFWAGYYGPMVRNPYIRLTYMADVCSVNPLSSPDCPGYAEAYFNQQCSANALYSPTCPGYTIAYKTQQCAANPLFDPTCPGYQTAYFNQQCSLNSLYDTKCNGYQQAYFTQQCNLNSLYNVQCPGYQQAFLTQQCDANPLYNINCVGYAEAYKAKLFADSCQANPQINIQCPGYKTPSTTMVQTASTPVAVVQDPIKSISETPLVSDPVVNQTLVNNSGNTNNQPQSNTTPSSLGTGISVPGLSITPNRSTSTSSRARETAVRSSLQTASRAEQVVKSEQDKQQDAAMASLGSVPGFDAYQSAKLPDAVFYPTKEIYKNVVLSDNVRAQRQLNQRSDRLHKEMIDSQYYISEK